MEKTGGGVIDSLPGRKGSLSDETEEVSSPPFFEEIGQASLPFRLR